MEFWHGRSSYVFAYFVVGVIILWVVGYFIKRGEGKIVKVKCYECEKEVDLGNAILVKFGFNEIFELAEELKDTELDGSIRQSLDEFGDFYICKDCNDRLGRAIQDILRGDR